MSGRRAPPNRRPSINEKIVVGNVTAQVSVGFYPDGRPCEVFIATSRPGSELALSLQDAAVLISVALQHGVTPRALTKSVARVPAAGAVTRTTAAPATIIGATLDLLAALEPA